MKFLANENFPLVSVRLLRQKNLDVAAVTEDSPGDSDRKVLQRAHQEERVILTFDRDYGELIFRQRAPLPAGVVYFRFDPEYPEEPAEHLLNFLQIEGLTVAGNFTVVDGKQIRQRPLP